MPYESVLPDIPALFGGNSHLRKMTYGFSQRTQVIPFVQIIGFRVFGFL